MGKSGGAEGELERRGSYQESGGLFSFIELNSFY